MNHLNLYYTQNNCILFHIPINLTILASELKPSEIAIFTAASEAFCQKNINCSIEESITRFEPVIASARAQDIRVRGYISCVLGCPYSGDIDPRKVAALTQRLLDLGCFEVSLGDTIGAGTPESTRDLMNALDGIDSGLLAAHFHDTGGRALENLLVALEYGIAVIDGSVGGLGGCPYAGTIAGNVCSENVLFMLHEYLGKLSIRFL